MSYVYKWIEGRDNVKEFCEKRFGAHPSFCETIGRCGGATIHLMYKYRDENDKSKGCVELYLLFMEHPSGTKTWKELNDVMTWSYDEIRADKSSLLK